MLIIDRFEEDFAVVEDTDTEKLINIEKSAVDANAKEGDVIFLTDCGEYRVDKAATEKRRAEILEMMKRLNVKKNK